MIIVCKNEKLNKYLERYINIFINSKGNKIIGIDFEFNRVKNSREIALCQIIFELNNKNDVFLFYPPNISKDIFKKLLIANNIIKILHGSESLDIPYLYSNILNNNDRDLFLKNLFDTRYMCEYYNIDNNIIDGKCKIYDLLLALKVINKNKYDELYKNDKLIGNIWEVFIDVKNLSKEVIKYSAYDVIYLPKLYRAFPKNTIYQSYIPNLSGISFNLRYNKELDSIYTSLSEYNFNKYYYDNTNILFNDLYIIIFNWILTNKLFYNLYNINYFKKLIEIIVKNLLYNKLDTNIKLIDFNINKDLLKKLNHEINIMLH
jgi:hypothetical protein